MAPRWTEEHDKIVEEYQTTFYHLCYRFDDGFEAEPSLILHPGISEGNDRVIEIVGRDH